MPRSEGKEDEWNRLPNYKSIPPVPDPQLLELVGALEHAPDDETIEIRPNVFVTKADVLREHGSFDVYRNRILWQLIKRRWCATLTDFNTDQIFLRHSPQYFVHYVSMVLSCVRGAFSQCGDLQDPLSVASLHARGVIRIVLKGGNCVAFIKQAALNAIPQSCRDTVSCIAPSSLSDLDLLVMIDYNKEPRIKPAPVFDRIHQSVLNCSECALDVLIDRLLQMTEQRDPQVANFSSFFAQMSDTASASSLPASLRAKLDCTTTELIEEVSQAVQAPSAPWVVALMSQLKGCLFAASATDHPDRCAKLVPFDRPCLRIRPYLDADQANERAGSEAGSELSTRGTRRRFYVSRNELVTHQDARCTKAEEVCSFALSRVFVGYLMQHPGLGKLGKESADPREGKLESECRLLKGEAVDVSVPLRFDVNLELYCDSEQHRAGSFMRPCTMSSGHTVAELYCESLSALILEQRDLTFGKRMKSLEVWRIAKASKRLGRLAELCGVKCLYLAGFSWEQKAAAFRGLGNYLAQFADAHLVKQPLGEKTNAAASAEGCRGLNRRVSLGEKKPDYHDREIGKSVSNSVKKPKKKGKRVLDSQKQEVRGYLTAVSGTSGHIHEQCLATEALLVPLRHLSLRVYGDKEAQRKVAATNCFAEQWENILKGQLSSIVMSFTQLFEQLQESRIKPHTFRESDLYKFNAGQDSWWDGGKPSMASIRSSKRLRSQFEGSISAGDSRATKRTRRGTHY